VSVICGEFLAISKRWAPKVFSAVLTDPPYGVTHLPWDSTGIRQEWLTEMLRLSSGPVFAFGAARPDRLRETLCLSPAPSRVLVWRNTKVTPTSGLFWSWQPIYLWRGSGILGWDTISCPSEGTLHPTQKPIRLMEALVRLCPPGKILDPFCGSGSTLVACQRLGRMAVGIEQDREMAGVAKRRLQGRTLSHLSLFR